MAIKINNTTVIDDNRNIVGTGLTVGVIYINSSPGISGQVLKSNGNGVEWGEATSSANFAETVGLLGL